MRSIVRDIYIKLPRYRFFDSPYPKSHGEDPKYMTRSKVEGQLSARLTNSNRSGSILVSGYRGVGKTSMVRKVLRDLKDAHEAETNIKASTKLGRYWEVLQAELKERLNLPRKLKNPQFIEVEVNLAQDELDVRTILRVMATELLRTLIKLDNRPSSRRYNWLQLSRLAIGIGTAICAWFLIPRLLAAESLWAPVAEAFTPEYGDAVKDWMNLLFRVGLPIGAGVFMFRLVRSAQRHRSPYYMEHSLDHLCDRLHFLIERISATVDEESQTGLTPSSTLPFSAFMRKRKAFPMASIKEIELELIDVLERFGRLDNDPFLKPNIDHAHVHDYNKRYLVFVVDELDKLVPRGFKSIWDKEREDPTDDAGPGATRPGIGPKGSDLYRERQEAVATLFANLKHFLNVAQAKFIFIGGHDLYDGVQADTSDRDPFFGSIFNQVIYVPTLLKEEQVGPNGTVRGLATTVERFVAASLLPGSAASPANHSLVTLADVHDTLARIHRTTVEQALHIEQALQAFCIYLTFRSNGSTKKLVQLFERSVVELTRDQIAQMTKASGTGPSTVIAGANATSKLVVSAAPDFKPGLYLRLSPVDQHAHGLLTHIYRPFLSELSRYYSQLNDKNLVSFTYLLDHLFKYHSTAFSFFHLQLTPEIIAVDKIPDYHKFMDDTIQRLSASSIRQVDNGLFGFQFYTKLYNEIAVLTKISDLDSAALNFSLDESLPVKQHFYRKLHQAKQNDSNRANGRMGHSPMALSSIHHTLGDLHFFDQQLDDALAQYRSATHLLEDEVKTLLRTPAHSQQRPQRDYINQYIKIKLKEILCLEKMKIFEVALAVSSQLTQDILSYVAQWRALGAQDIGNWRLLTLGLVHRLALLDKTARKGILPEDLKALHTYLEEIRIANRLTLGQPIPLEAALHEHLGTVIFYSGKNIVAPAAGALNGATAREAYARALSIALWNDRRPTLLTQDIWNDVNMLDAMDKPKAQIVANCLSKYSDTLIANRAFGPMTVTPASPVMVFAGVNVNNLLLHPDTGDIAAHILATAKAYLSCDSQFQAVFQVKKLLHLLLERTRATNGSALPFAEIDSLCDWAIAAVHAYNGRVDALQVAKGREHLRAHQMLHDWQLSRLVSYSADLREIEVLRNELYLKAGLITGHDVSNRYQGELSESTSTFTRTRVLMLCIRANWGMLDSRITSQFRGGAPNPVGSRARISLAGVNSIATVPLVRDALINCFMLMDAAQLYGTGFVANNTVMGKVKAHLADWCLILQALPASHQHYIQRQLQALLGDRYSTRLDPVMYYTMALAHFRKAASMHGRGKQYRRVMNDMYMLEDDYKDNFYHFCCAMERMVVNDTGTAGLKQRMVQLRLTIQALNLRRAGRVDPPTGRRRAMPKAERYA